MDSNAEISQRATVPVGQAVSAGALVFDEKGRIISCSDTAAKIFGGRVADLESSTIWHLISGGAHNKTPAGVKKHYLANLTASRGWHRFCAFNRDGGEFPLEFSMLKIDSGMESLFLLNFRRTNLA